MELNHYQEIGWRHSGPRLAAVGACTAEHCPTPQPSMDSDPVTQGEHMTWPKRLPSLEAWAPGPENGTPHPILCQRCPSLDPEWGLCSEDPRQDIHKKRLGGGPHRLTPSGTDSPSPAVSRRHNDTSEQVDSNHGEHIVYHLRWKSGGGAIVSTATWSG